MELKSDIRPSRFMHAGHLKDDTIDVICLIGSRKPDSKNRDQLSIPVLFFLDGKTPPTFFSGSQSGLDDDFLFSFYFTITSRYDMRRVSPRPGSPLANWKKFSPV